MPPPLRLPGSASRCARRKRCSATRASTLTPSGYCACPTRAASFSHSFATTAGEVCAPETTRAHNDTHFWRALHTHESISNCWKEVFYQMARALPQHEQVIRLEELLQRGGGGGGSRGATRRCGTQRNRLGPTKCIFGWIKEGMEGEEVVGVGGGAAFVSQSLPRLGFANGRRRGLRAIAAQRGWQRNTKASKGPHVQFLLSHFFVCVRAAESLHFRWDDPVNVCLPALPLRLPECILVGTHAPNF